MAKENEMRLGRFWRATIKPHTKPPGPDEIEDEVLKSRVARVRGNALLRWTEASSRALLTPRLSR